MTFLVGTGYFGSKATSGLCQPIIAMMPPHDAYRESHIGGGAIKKQKPPALNNIGIDIDLRPLSDFECHYPVDLVNCCAHDLLAHCEYHGSELVYCDPPYLLKTRTSPRKFLIKLNFNFRVYRPPGGIGETGRDHLPRVWSDTS